MRLKKTAILCLILILALTSCGTKLNGAKTITPEIGNIEKTVSETGIIVFDDSYAISSVVSAKILTADFSEGDMVEKGQVLYTLDNKEIRNQITQANISLEKANEAHRQSQSAVNDLTVKSFVTGNVTNVYCHVGDYVSPGMKIADVVDKKNLILQVPFNITRDIYVGSPATVIMDFDGSILNGNVSKIHESSEPLDGRQVGVNVEITVVNPGALKQGDVGFAKIGELASVSSGALKNKTEQSISATQSGQVIELNIKEGENVNSGSVVMKIKNDSLVNAANTAALNIKDIKTSISQLNDKLPDFNVLAPVSGVVIEKTAKEGDLAVGGAPLSMIADNGELYLEVDIDELYIKEVAQGQTVTAAVQGSDDRSYTGRVTKIDDSGTARNGVTYYKVRISLSENEGLMEAMNMDAKIIIASKENALLVPLKALNGNKLKILSEKKEIIEQEVSVGIKNKEYAEILSGLSKEDRLVVHPD